MTCSLFDRAELDRYRSSLDNVANMFCIANDLLEKDRSLRDEWPRATRTK